MKNVTQPKVKEQKEFPHILVILLVVLAISAICTWIVPAGAYDRILDEVTGRMIIDPSSFHYLDKTPVGLFQMFVCLEEGLIQAANITFLIFCAFSSLYLLEKTGAIDAAIALMVRKTQNHPRYASSIIVIVMIILAIWASTGTMSYEEIIAFIPIFVAVSMALGYDAMVGVAISVVPVGVGFASATVNPFTVGVAQTIAELPMFSGLGYRILILAVMTLYTIIYVLLYASKVKKDPTKSLTYGIDYSDMIVDEERLNTPMTTARKLSLLTLLIGVAVMAWGLITQGWYINQVAAIFMMIAIVVGVINRWKANKIATVLVEGLSKGVLSAIIVGVARGVLVILTKGNIIDTLIHGCVSLIENLSLYASSVGMLLFQTLLNFLVPSGSGQAAVSMPIMTPIADLIGMNRQIAVLIFQFGDGFSNLLWPTSFMVIACAMAKIPLNKYYKWVTPFLLIGFLIQIAFIYGAIAMNYGPM
ncbi:YfcC family protein [Anaerovorax sp. IOR16]|uniref:YfcC family protein n=1 Tax=Anaerovorax sp. IOR16 TaxID=2773458 RepID=UPI0019D21A6B|nr:TIGR00366 family protein [Anaerovorax sp. IOR16]